MLPSDSELELLIAAMKRSSDPVKPEFHVALMPSVEINDVNEFEPQTFKVWTGEEFDFLPSTDFRLADERDLISVWEWRDWKGSVVKVQCRYVQLYLQVHGEQRLWRCEIDGLLLQQTRSGRLFTFDGGLRHKDKPRVRISSPGDPNAKPVLAPREVLGSALAGDLSRMYMRIA